MSLLDEIIRKAGEGSDVVPRDDGFRFFEQGRGASEERPYTSPGTQEEWNKAGTRKHMNEAIDIIADPRKPDAEQGLDNIAGGNLADPYLAKMLAAAALKKEKKPEKTINKKEEERAAAFERSRKLKKMMSNISRPKPLSLFDTDLL